MLTLTVSSTDYPSHAEAAEAIKRGLRLLRLRLRRHPRLADFEFMAIFEAHESGFPHLHLLIRGAFIPWAWLTKNWTKITGSSHVDIRKVKGRKNAARYVAKYLGKDIHAFEGCKRWWRSHGYDLAPANDDDDERARKQWTRINLVWSSLLAALDAEGWKYDEKPGPRLEVYRPPGASAGLLSIATTAAGGYYRQGKWDFL
jgi:hypothetical protein